MPAKESNWSDWTAVQLTRRFNLLLAASVAIFLLANTTVVSYSLTMLAALAGMALLYGGAIFIIVSNDALKALPDRRTTLVTVAMVVFIAATGLLVNPGNFAILQYIPALYAALRLAPGQVWLTGALCSLGWGLLHNYGVGIVWASVLPTLVQIIPLVLLVAIVSTLSTAVRQARLNARASSAKDELSGFLNMRAFTRLIESQHLRAGGQPNHYAVLMLDIDGLQKFNDQFGHEQGDRVIIAVADAIRRSVRNADLIARYGGDEFVIYLPNTDDATSEVVSNRISQNVYNISLSFERSAGRVKVNIGRGVFPDSGKRLQDIMIFATQAMYRDKEFKRRIGAKPNDPDALRKQAGVRDWM